MFRGLYHRSGIFLFALLVTPSLLCLFFCYNSTQFFHADGIGLIVPDSKRYYTYSETIDGLHDLVPYLTINKNLAGPLFFFGYVLKGNLVAYVLSTTSLFLFGIAQLYTSKLADRTKDRIFLFFIVNLAAVASFTGPSKEGTGYLSFIFLLNYVLRRSKASLTLSLSFALFTRFEHLLVVVAFLLARLLGKNLRLFFIVSLLAFLSILIWQLEYSHMHKLLANEREGSIGLVKTLAVLGEKGLFFITFLPKLFLNLFGNLFVQHPFNIEGYSILLYLSHWLFLFLLSKAFIRGSLKIQSDFFLLFTIYCIVFTVPAFVHHRYFVPVYPVLVFLAFHRGPLPIHCGRFDLVPTKGDIRFVAIKPKSRF